jgi:hypothetical protein
MKRGRQQIPMSHGDELDAFSKWRRALCVFYNNTNIVKQAQRRYNKRLRRQWKQELRDEE